MTRKLLLLLLLSLPACSSSSGPEADLQHIKQARSLGAEWALVNEQAGKRHLTGKYVRSMRRWLRENLQTSSQSLRQPKSGYGEEIQALLAEPDDAAPRALRSHVRVLKKIEDSLESA